MPRKPWFESRRTQQTAIAVALGLVLVLSLGAVLLTTGPGQRVGLAGVTVPISNVWEVVGRNRLTLEGAEGEELVFSSRGNSRQELVLGAVQYGAAVDPTTARAQLVEAFVETEVRPARTEVTESGPFEVAWFIGFASRGELAQQHLFAVLTVDRQRYWLVHLTGLTSARGLRSAIEVDAYRLRRTVRGIELEGEA